MQVYSGRPLAGGWGIGIVVSRFNEEITSRLLDGALDALRGAGVADDSVAVCHVPGAFELPLAADRLASGGERHAIIALGAVIRGETDHYDYICQAVSHGLRDVGLRHGVPVLFGVLTCATEEQARERSGGSHGNKGADVALDALRMADLLSRLATGAPDGNRP